MLTLHKLYIFFLSINDKLKNYFKKKKKEKKKTLKIATIIEESNNWSIDSFKLTLFQILFNHPK